MKKKTLNILLNGIHIGYLEKVAAGNLIFRYTDQWLTMPGARPISLSMPLLQQNFTGDVVYNFFDNLLPDNPQVRARIQTQFQVSVNQPFDLLNTIGKDCVGAIQLVTDESLTFKKAIACEPLTAHEIANILRDYQNYPLGMQNNETDFRISIAGAQEKAAFLWYQQQWHRPLKDTPTSHIFKLPIGLIAHQQIDLRDSCENEWLCAQIVEAFGLPVAKSEILYFEDIKVLVVERFDRKFSSDQSWLMRLPQEDMCQALGISPNLKYQADGGPGIKEIMQLLLGSSHSNEDRELFFKTQIIFWLLAAIDGHAKNFSLFLQANGKYRLTPLYDIMSAYPLMASKQLQAQKIKMAMALKGKNNHYHWSQLQKRLLLDTAKFVNYSIIRTEEIIHELLKQIDPVIEKIIKNLPVDFPENIAESIFAGIKNTAKKLN